MSSDEQPNPAFTAPTAPSTSTDSADGGKKSKKSKSKAKGASAQPATNGTSSVVASASGGNPPHLSPDQQENLRRAIEVLNLAQQGSAPKSESEATRKTYQFWSTQPVPSLDEVITDNEAINPDPPIDKVRQEPYTLPPGYEWATLSLDDPLVLTEVYQLLNENYVEDDDNMFRFDYSSNFIKWALQPPGWIKEWHCGVRATKTGKLFGFISAVPARIRMYEKKKQMVEINFLCVHKKLRSKRLAPVLIREITRRVNIKGIFQAVYTAGVVLPKPLGTCRYWHRSLNPKKLIEVKFSHLSKKMTMQRHIKLYKLPNETKTPGMRKFDVTDASKVCQLLNQYLDNFDLAPVFEDTDVLHWFTPQADIVESYVVESPENPGVITDFVSFYALPSTVMHHPTHKNIKAAYSFYNVSTATPWVDLMGDGLVLAKQENFDVFNALDLMHNSEFLEKLKFGVGDGNLQYYLYNWRCPSMKPEKIGLVLQ